MNELEADRRRRQLRGLFSEDIPGVDDESPRLKIADVHGPHNEVRAIAGGVVLHLLLFLRLCLSAPQDSCNNRNQLKGQCYKNVDQRLFRDQLYRDMLDYCLHYAAQIPFSAWLL